MARTVLTTAQKVFPWVAAAGAAAGLFALWRSQEATVSAYSWSVSWSALTGAALAYSVAPIAQAVSFWLALRLLTGRSPLLPTLLAWSRSYILRYAPTGTLAIAYRLHARGRMEASAEQVLAAYAYEHVAALAAGALACVMIFALAGGLPPLLPLAIAMLALLLTAAARPGMGGHLAQSVARRFHLHLEIVLGSQAVAALVAINLIGWLGTGCAVHILVRGLIPDAPGFTWIVGAYTAGYLVGFVTPLAPGGIGAREGTLVALFTARWGVGTAVSLALRLANVIGELLAVTAVHAACGAVVVARRVRLRRVAVQTA
jgi:glycosyltransferase 2 family protein